MRTMQHLLTLALAAATSTTSAFAQAPTAASQSPANLKDTFKGAFYVGVAVNASQITGADAAGDALIVQQFNSITPENVMKWALIHPRPDAYDFTNTIFEVVGARAVCPVFVPRRLIAR